MGVFDTIEVARDVDLPEFDDDPSDVWWQSKSIGRTAMDHYRITSDYRLLTRRYNDEGSDTPTRGSPAVYWSEFRDVGQFTFYASVDDEWYEFLVTVTRADVDSIERVEQGYLR